MMEAAPLLGAAGRLRAALEAETAELGRGGGARFADFAARKDRLLVELRRAFRASGVGPGDLRRAALLELRAALAENARAIGHALAACRVLSASIEAAVAEAQSDGTYRVRRGGAGRS